MNPTTIKQLSKAHEKYSPRSYAHYLISYQGYLYYTTGFIILRCSDWEGLDSAVSMDGIYEPEVKVPNIGHLTFPDTHESIRSENLEPIYNQIRKLGVETGLYLNLYPGDLGQWEVSSTKSLSATVLALDTFVRAFKAVPKSHELVGIDVADSVTFKFSNGKSTYELMAVPMK